MSTKDQSQFNQHHSVLLNESIEYLSIKPDGIYIDCTFGRGGHSKEILKRLGSHGHLFALDRDPQAAEFASNIEDERFTFIHAPFSTLMDFEPLELQPLKPFIGQIDGMLFDLGVSSPQLDDPNRGFSFMRDGPLDMRMDPTKGVSASEWLHQSNEQEISWVLKTFGEERFARRIAKAIVEYCLLEQDLVRPKPRLERTSQLAQLISDLIPNKFHQGKHPATRSFQGIRIFINSELEEINRALNSTLSLLKPGGRLAVISFHSLEDRIVKQFIQKQSERPQIPAGLALTETQLNALADIKLEKISKAIKPTSQEIERNPRSRSSILRIAQRV